MHFILSFLFKILQTRSYGNCPHLELCTRGKVVTFIQLRWKPFSLKLSKARQQCEVNMLAESQHSVNIARPLQSFLLIRRMKVKPQSRERTLPAAFTKGFSHPFVSSPGQFGTYFVCLIFTSMNADCQIQRERIAHSSSQTFLNWGQVRAINNNNDNSQAILSVSSLNEVYSARCCITTASCQWVMLQLNINMQLLPY